MGPGGRETSGETVAARQDQERLDGVFLTKRKIITSLGVCQLLPAVSQVSGEVHNQWTLIVDRVQVRQKDWMRVYGTIHVCGVRK